MKVEVELQQEDVFVDVLQLELSADIEEIVVLLLGKDDIVDALRVKIRGSLDVEFAMEIFYLGEKVVNAVDRLFRRYDGSVKGAGIFLFHEDDLLRLIPT